MNTQHVRTGHAHGEVPPNTFADFNWAGEHYQELLEQYGESVILVFEKRVIGIGKSEREAVEDAEAKLPANFDKELTPITYYLADRKPFFRIRPSVIGEKY